MTTQHTGSVPKTIFDYRLAGTPINVGFHAIAYPKPLIIRPIYMSPMSSDN